MFATVVVLIIIAIATIIRKMDNYKPSSHEQNW